MMCGLLKPDAGRVMIHGQPVDGSNQKTRHRVGVCPQSLVLWPKLTCLEQLQFVGELYGLGRRDARKHGETLLQELDLAEKRNVLAQKLSGGMQRRLNLALALVHDPQIVVLDEPEAGLDPQSRIRVRENIQSLARKKTVILTTHNMDEAERLADRVAIIDHGQLLVMDTPQALKQRVGSGDVIEIALNTVPPDPPKLQAALVEIGATMQLSSAGDLLTVRGLNAVNLLPDILAVFSAAKIQPGEVRMRQNSLEDVFIQLTGRRLRE
jgi:ABC-2 type transport system ATP-binding protein